MTNLAPTYLRCPHQPVFPGSSSWPTTRAVLRMPGKSLTPSTCTPRVDAQEGGGSPRPALKTGTAWWPRSQQDRPGLVSTRPLAGDLVLKPSAWCATSPAAFCGSFAGKFPGRRLWPARRPDRAPAALQSMKMLCDRVLLTLRPPARLERTCSRPFAAGKMRYEPQLTFHSPAVGSTPAKQSQVAKIRD